MGYMARWGPKGFLVSPEKIVPIIELKTALSLDKDTGSLDSQEIELSTNYYKAAGVDPRAQWEEWKSLVGEAYPFYIGNERFGPKKMKLMGINLSDLLLTNSGEFLAVTIGLIFTEYDEPPVTVSSDGTGGPGSTGGTGNTGSNGITTPLILTKAITAPEQEYYPAVYPLEHYLPAYIRVSSPRDGKVTIAFHISHPDPYYVGYEFPNGAVIERKIEINNGINYVVRLPY